MGPKGPGITDGASGPSLFVRDLATGNIVCSLLLSFPNVVVFQHSVALCPFFHVFHSIVCAIYTEF
jgi:hypothetical protein